MTMQMMCAYVFHSMKITISSLVIKILKIFFALDTNKILQYPQHSSTESEIDREREEKKIEMNLKCFCTHECNVYTCLYFASAPRLFSELRFVYKCPAQFNSKMKT